MENIVNKLISDILLMNADVIRSNIKSIDNLQNLPADIAAEISNLLEELDYSIDEMSREAANDPELRKAVSDFITAKSKRKESKTMDRAWAILEQKDGEILTPILDRVKLLAKQNDEYAKYLYEIYETIYLSAVPLDVVVVTLTEYKYPSEDMEK